jgi:polysaccharide export outer membrane protein
MLMNRRLLPILSLFVLALAGMAYAVSGDEGQSAAPMKQVASANQATATPALKQRNPRYQLQKGDVFVLDFPFTPEFNETVTVQPDGFINVRGLEDMHVEGKTAPEVQEALKTAYSKILHDPVVTVTLQTFVTPSFVAYGEVGKPGKYDLHGDTTLTQGIAIAGGFTGAAKHSEVYLFRRVSNEWVSSQKIDVKKMMKSGNLAEDLHLQPGDMVWVPKNTMSKVLQIAPLIPYNLFRLNFGPYN